MCGYSWIIVVYHNIHHHHHNYYQPYRIWVFCSTKRSVCAHACAQLWLLKALALRNIELNLIFFLYSFIFKLIEFITVTGRNLNIPIVFLDEMIIHNVNIRITTQPPNLTYYKHKWQLVFSSSHFSITFDIMSREWKDNT